MRPFGVIGRSRLLFGDRHFSSSGWGLPTGRRGPSSGYLLCTRRPTLVQGAAWGFARACREPGASLAKMRRLRQDPRLSGGIFEPAERSGELRGVLLDSRPAETRRRARLAAARASQSAHFCQDGARRAGGLASLAPWRPASACMPEDRRAHLPSVRHPTRGRFLGDARALPAWTQKHACAGGARWPAKVSPDLRFSDACKNLPFVLHGADESFILTQE